MPTERISYRNFTRGLWLKGPRENTPEGAMRHATGVFPTRGGSALSRSGSAFFYDLDAHSLFKFAGHRIIGTDGQLWQGTTPGTEVQVSFAGVSFAPTGQRLNFMEIPSQFLATNPNQDPTLLTGTIPFNETDFLFICEQPGTGVPFKIDASFNVSKWGIVAPTAAQLPTAAIQTAGTTDIDTLQSAGVGSWSEFGGADGASPTGSTRSATGGTSTRVRPTVKNTEVIIVKGITTDLTTVGGGTSSDEDYIGVWIHLNRPKHAHKLKLSFFTGPGPFVQGNFVDPNGDANAPYTDYYSKEIVIKTVRRKQLKPLIALGDVVPFENPKKLAKFLRKHPKAHGTDFTLSQFTAQDQLEVTNNTWTHVLVPKAQFAKNGQAGNAGFTWANIIGVELSLELNNQGKTSIWWDHLQLLGGAGLKGDYLWTMTFRNNNTGSRSNPPMDLTGNVQSNPNFGQIQTVAAAGVDRQTVKLHFTVTQAQIAAIDPQITHVELWRNIGNGGVSAFFKVPNGSAPGIPVASFNGAFDFIDQTADYIGMFSAGAPAVLDPTEVLTTDNSPPPTTLSQAVYHPPSGRVFALDAANTNRVLYSPPGRPESLGNGGFIEPSTPDDPLQRLVIWGDQLYAFTHGHVFLITGTDEPFVSLEAIGSPGTQFPLTCVATPQGIVYQAFDGVRLFNGTTSDLVADDALSQIFRGSTAEGIPPFSGVIASYGRDEYVVSDTVNTTLALNMRDQSWRSVGIALNAIYHEKDTSICLASMQAASQGVGALIIQDQTASMSLNTTNFLGALSSPFARGSVAGAVQHRMPISGTFTAMYILLPSALGGGGSVTLQLVVNGVLQAGLVLTLASGATNGNAVGSVAFNSDDLVYLQATFAGGTTVLTFQALTLAYASTLG